MLKIYFRDLIESYKKSVVLIFMVLLVLLIVINNINNLLHNCFNANDFSIYQQPIYDIAFGSSWNPQMTIKDQAIFNDHFDPAIVLASGFVKIFGPSEYGLVIFEWLWFVFLILISYFVLKKEQLITSALDTRWLVIFSMIVFSRSLLQGLEFVIHPTTWSMLPIFLLFYFIKNKNVLGICITALISMTFREIIPLMITALSFSFLLKKELKTFIAVFLIGAAGSFFIVVIRPKIIGPSVQYTGGIASALISSHIFYVWKQFKNFIPHFEFKLFMQYLIPIIILIKLEIKSFKELLTHPITAAFFFMAPAFGVHMLVGYFVHHHSIPLITPFIAVIALSSFPKFITQKENKRLLLLFLAILIGIGSSRYTKMFQATFLWKKNNCEMSLAKLASTQEMLKIVDAIPNSMTIIATGGIIPHLVRPLRPVYQFFDSTKIINFYDYLILEKGFTGDIYPLSPLETDEIRERCRPLSDKIIFEDSYYSVFTGKFTDDCLHLEKRWPGKSKFVP